MTTKINVDGATFSLGDAAKILNITQSQLSHRLQSTQPVIINGMTVQRMKEKKYHKGFQTRCIETGRIFKSLPELSKHLGKEHHGTPVWQAIRSGQTYKDDNGYHYEAYDLQPKIEQGPRAKSNRMNYLLKKEAAKKDVKTIETKLPSTPKVEDIVRLPVSQSEPNAKEVLKKVAIDFIHRDCLHEAKAVIGAIEKL